ncbi:unnamed protein product [Caenorhabditis nigoni]
MSSSCSTSNSANSKIKEINVIVVGVSGSETVKGPSGVGKSLLCNRFVRPAADEFHREHSSVLSQIDFCGSPVINKDHWLYWGSRLLNTPETSTPSILIRVAEQTEFLDDETFETIGGCSKSEDYYHRCSRTSLQSRDKLMYIQKEQLGLESEFPQHLLPDGKFNVDGFILACDISKNSQLHTNQILNIAKSIAKTKKPILIAFTKCDEMSEDSKKHYMNLFMGTKELKHVLCNLSPVETSAVKNVNVEYLFGTMGLLCLRNQKLVKKALVYQEASLFVEQRNLHVKCCFSTLLAQAVPLCVYPKKCLSWKQVLADIDRHPDLQNFVTVFGSRVAFEMYERYVSEAKELWAMNRLRSLVPRLTQVFQVFLDVVDLAEMEWNMARDYIRCHPLFNALFECNDYDVDLWNPTVFNADNKSARLPAELLLLPEARDVFEQFRVSTQNLRHIHQLSQELEYLLHEVPQIFPGSSLESSFPYFQNFSITKKLTPDVIAEAYSRFQQKLMENARGQLEECLLEVSSAIQNSWGPTEYVHVDLKRLERVRSVLDGDQRYEWMKMMEGERDQMILSFLPFIFNASPLNCPTADMCIDIVGTSILNDFSEQTSTFGGSSGFSECFEATRRNSGKRMPRIQICAMCGDRISIDSLATSLFHNDLIRSSNLNYSSDGSSYLEILDESTQNWNTLEISMNSFHSWFHQNDQCPMQFLDFTDAYLFVYNSARASSFNYARCAIEKLALSVNFDCILLVAVVEETETDSMKLNLEYLSEGAELCKAIGARFSVIDFRKRKTNVLNRQMMEFLNDVLDGQVQTIRNMESEEIRSLENDRPSMLAPSFTSSGIQLLTKPDTTNRSRRQKAGNSNLRNRVTRTDPLILSHFYSTPIDIQPAPLATPEHVDFSPAYSLVNDAVHTIIQVNGSSPKTAASPIFNKYDSSPETRSTTSTVSAASSAPRAVSADVTRRSRTSNVSLSNDSINRLHRTSNLFQLHPETAITAEQKQKSLSIESLTKEKEKDRSRGFVRKVATSFRLRKNLGDTDEGKKKEENKKKTSVTTSPEQISSFLEKMATRSLPQSPRTDRKAKLYSSLNSTTEKVSNVLSWIPSKSSKRLMKNKSATHDLSTSLINCNTASTSTQGVIAANENLETLCSSSTSGIPVYLEKCIEFIENNGGFEQEGLYRVPGNQTHLAELEKRFLKKGEFDVTQFDTPVHVAATALKSFFSCLPESLIPTDFHPRWKQIMMVEDEQEKINGIRDALSQLPSSNQQVLRYLVMHLSKVSCSPKTVMNSNNLAKVWTPTLFRPVFTSYEELSSGIIAFQLALELLIVNAHSLFPISTLL